MSTTSPEERLPTMTIIKLNYIHSNEAKWRRPTVDSTTTHGTGPLPTFITTDATGRIMEPHDGLLHPTSSWISIVPRKIDDNEHAEHERSLLRTALTDNPEWLIGRQAHKFFPEWMGTCRAEVTGYDSKTKLWTVTYEADGVSEEFDYEDMNKYVIDRICGTAPADGGAALKRNAEASHNGDSVSTYVKFQEQIPKKVHGVLLPPGRTAGVQPSVQERTGSCTLVQPCLVYLVIHPGSVSRVILLVPGLFTG